MSAKQDSQRGLHAVVHASREDVVAACTRACAFLGKKASLTTSSAALTVHIYPGLVQKLSSVSPTVAIRLKPGNAGEVVVDVAVERFRTVQSRYLMIPVGPKRLVGKSSYFNLLKSLDQELRAIDNGSRGQVQFTGLRA